MATIRKHRGNWQVQIRRKGAKTVTRSFSTKGAAATFARKTEHAMDVARNPDDVSTLSKITIGELIERYRDTVTPTKKSIVQETYRLNYLLRQPISDQTLDRLSTGMFAQ